MDPGRWRRISSRSSRTWSSQGRTRTDGSRWSWLGWSWRRISWTMTPRQSCPSSNLDNKRIFRNADDEFCCWRECIFLFHSLHRKCHTLRWQFVRTTVDSLVIVHQWFGTKYRQVHLEEQLWEQLRLSWSWKVGQSLRRRNTCHLFQR